MLRLWARDGARVTSCIFGPGEELRKPELLFHPGTVVGPMKIQDDWDKFYAQLNQTALVPPDNPTLFDDAKDRAVPGLKGQARYWCLV